MRPPDPRLPTRCTATAPQMQLPPRQTLGDPLTDRPWEVLAPHLPAQGSWLPGGRLPLCLHSALRTSIIREGHHVPPDTRLAPKTVVSPPGPLASPVGWRRCS